MSWCDKLASRPTVGFTFNKHFRPSSELLSAITPVLDELAGKIADKFTLIKQDSFGLEFITESGFKYFIDAARIGVEFQHRMRLVNASGGVPVMKMLSKPEPFTHMLMEVSKRAVDAAELLIGANRTLERIGVVSTTFVNEDDAPPGIRRGIEYLCGPWSRGVDAYQFQVVGHTVRTAEWADRCVHNFAKPETDEEDKLVNLVFDYQRDFSGKRMISSARASVATVQEAALAYFEELAQGDMFDANSDAISK